MKRNGQPRPEFFTSFFVTLPVAKISLLNKETKEILCDTGIETIEELVRKNIDELPRREDLVSVVTKIKNKPYVLEKELRVLKYLNNTSPTRLTRYEADTILSLCMFSFLYNGRDLREVIELSLHHLFSEEPCSRKWHKRNEKIIKVVQLHIYQKAS